MATKTFSFNSDQIKSYNTERIIRLYKFAYGEEATARFFNVWEEREAMTMSLLGWAQRIGAAVVAAMLGVPAELQSQTFEIEGVKAEVASQVSRKNKEGREEMSAIFLQMMVKMPMYKAIARNHEVNAKIDRLEFSPLQVHMMRALKKAGMTYKELLEEYGSCHNTIFRVVNQECGYKYI